MKILIAPEIQQGRSDPNTLLSQQLVSLFTNAGHSCIFSAPEDAGIKDVHLYPSPSPKKPVFSCKDTMHYYEDVMAAKGCLSLKYLHEDYQSLVDIADETIPDLIITIDRIAPVIFAHNRKIKCWTIVQADMYKGNKTPRSGLKDLNAFLSNWHLKPVTQISEIWKLCDKRIGFGPIDISPFITENNVERIGITSITPESHPKENHIVMYLNQISTSKSAMEKLIKDTFLGAPYDVYAWFPGSQRIIEDNIHFLSYADMKYLDGADVMIHDGNSFFTNQCMARGIKQLVVHDHGYQRLANAFALKHTRTALELYEEELSVAVLYELYRKLVTNDTYQKQADVYQKMITADGDITKLLSFLSEIPQSRDISFLDIFTRKETDQ